MKIGVIYRTNDLVGDVGSGNSVFLINGHLFINFLYFHKKLTSQRASMLLTKFNFMF